MQFMQRRHSLRSCVPWSLSTTFGAHLGKMAFLIQRRAASCHCHHRHFMTTLTVLPPSLALLQLATQGQLKVFASCPVAQPNAASLGKACRL